MPRSRVRLLLWTAIALVLVASGTLWAGWYYVPGTPEYSLYLLVRAIQDRDRVAADRYLSREKIADSVVDQAMQTAVAKGVKSGGDVLALGLAQMMRPALTHTVRDLLGVALQGAMDEDAFKDLRGSAFRTFMAVRRGVAVKQSGSTARVTVSLRDGKPTQLVMSQGPDRLWQIVAIDPHWFQEYMREGKRQP